MSIQGATLCITAPTDTKLKILEVKTAPTDITLKILEVP